MHAGPAAVQLTWHDLAAAQAFASNLSFGAHAQTHCPAQPSAHRVATASCRFLPAAALAEALQGANAFGVPVRGFSAPSHPALHRLQSSTFALLTRTDAWSSPLLQHMLKPSQTRHSPVAMLSLGTALQPSNGGNCSDAWDRIAKMHGQRPVISAPCMPCRPIFLAQYDLLGARPTCLPGTMRPAELFHGAGICIQPLPMLLSNFSLQRLCRAASV